MKESTFEVVYMIKPKAEMGR